MMRLALLVLSLTLAAATCECGVGPEEGVGLKGIPAQHELLTLRRVPLQLW